jgi:hypothetical protein
MSWFGGSLPPKDWLPVQTPPAAWRKWSVTFVSSLFSDTLEGKSS